MYIKLALGNVRRSLRDYSVYFATHALAACLLYSFIASGDYLLALDLTPDQRSIYAKSGTVLEGFSVFVVVIFIFLVAYANRFIVRRRKREFGLYALVGMPRHGVAAVLALEGLVVGAASLAAGIILGGLLSPVFSAIAAFVFDAPWRGYRCARRCACALRRLLRELSFTTCSALCSLPFLRWCWEARRLRWWWRACLASRLRLWVRIISLLAARVSACCSR